MAAPGLTLGTPSTQGTAAGSHSVNLPSGTADKVIWILTFGASSYTVAATGWTVSKTLSITSVRTLTILTRASTSETSVSVTTSVNTTAAWVGGSTDGDIANTVFSTGASGVTGTANPDPDTVTVSSGDYRVVAFTGWTDARRSVSAYPTNYTDTQANPQLTGNNTPALAVSSRGLTGITSENPGTYTLTGNSGVHTIGTLAIPPATAGANEGEVTGSIAWVGSVTGTTVRSGAVTGSIGWVGSVTGITVRSGAASGSVAWAGTVSGEAPALVQDGEALGSVAWAGTVSGTTVRSGSASGAVGWAGVVDGEAPFPVDIPSAAVIAYYDARTISGSVSDPVASWADLGPVAQDPLAHATSGFRPTINESGFGGLRAVLFDGVDDRLDVTLDQTYSGDFALIVVLEIVTFPAISLDAGVVYSTGGIPNKNILAIDDATDREGWTVMSTDGAQSDHYTATDNYANMASTPSRFVITQLIRDAGELRLWENQVLILDLDLSFQAPLNDMPGLKVGMREDNSRPAHIRVGAILLVDMDTATQAELLTARDDLGAQWQVPGFGTSAEGFASGAIDWDGTVNGITTRAGEATGSISWAGTVTGATTRQGSVAGSLAWSGSVTGATEHEGATSGGITWSGSVTGESPTPGVQEGSASGAIGWAGSVTGETVHAGSATGSIGWSGSVTGTAKHEGSVTGSIAWAGSVTGASDEPPFWTPDPVGYTPAGIGYTSDPVAYTPRT
jgi:hypothetical protein